MPARFFDVATLAAEEPRLATPSDLVRREVGVAGVAERAALAAVGAQNGALLGTNEPDSDAAAEYSHGCGVTIGFIREFTDTYDCWNWPTWRVMRDIVKPLTAAR